MTLDTLVDQPVWRFFNELLTIPRESQHEERVQNWLKGFAQAHGFTYAQDAKGNLRMDRGESPDVVLQAHTDMVCVSEDGTHDFSRDPIRAYVDGEYVRARGTTLGADNGIGVAAAMEALLDNRIEGPLGALFTVDEERGLVGVRAIDPKLVHGKTLINMDSEDWGEIIVGCAGGKDTTGRIPYEQVPTTSASWYNLEIRGLPGGHSGIEIDEPRGNAIKVLVDTLKEVGYELASINGGTKRNVIPSHASALVGLGPRGATQVRESLSAYSQGAPYDVNFSLTPAERPEYGMTREVATSLVDALGRIDHGVLERSPDDPSVVRYSNNLAVVTTSSDTITVETMHRGPDTQRLDDVSGQIRGILEGCGAEVTASPAYSGWAPSADSRILSATKEVYTRLFGEEPRVDEVHAGLECGVLIGANPTMEAISFGPTIKGAHSPAERVEIATVGKFYKLLVETVRHLQGPQVAR